MGRMIELGALAPPIRDQFPELSPQVAEHLDRIADAIIYLGIHGVITPTERARARAKLVKKVGAALPTPTVEEQS